MRLKAGHCTDCGTPIWRTVQHPRTDESMLLYPDPTSRYARVRVGERESPGIGYCAACCPTVGDWGPDLAAGPSIVTAVDAAPRRYQAWFTPAWGAHFRAWLRDHLDLPEPAYDALVAQWEHDRATIHPAEEPLHG